MSKHKCYTNTQHTKDNGSNPEEPYYQLHGGHKNKTTKQKHGGQLEWMGGGYRGSVKNQDIFSVACNQDVVSMVSHPVVLEHLGHTLLLQECHPINRAAERAAGCICVPQKVFILLPMPTVEMEMISANCEVLCHMSK